MGVVWIADFAYSSNRQDDYELPDELYSGNGHDLRPITFRNDASDVTLLMHIVNDIFYPSHELNYLLRNKYLDVNATDSLGQTALMYAIDVGNRFAVSELVNAGADVNARNYLGQTPLMYAAGKSDGYSNNGTWIIDFLIWKGADNAVDDLGRTALMHAAGHGYRRLVGSLLWEFYCELSGGRERFILFNDDDPGEKRRLHIFQGRERFILIDDDDPYTEEDNFGRTALTYLNGASSVSQQWKEEITQMLRCGYDDFNGLMF